MKITPIRGTHDFFGQQVLKYRAIQDLISHYSRIYNFEEIITPIFESTELFKKPLGENTDVVLKEMYTFKDKNEDFITLRPEYTTPMIRSAISNNLLEKLPKKLYGIGPMFRRERPQKGRYRQFNQINFENFGTDDFFADIEMINLANQLLKKILPNNQITLHINTLGSRENLQNYKKVLSKYFKDHQNSLSIESKSKIETNPLRILDSKNIQDKETVLQSPKLIEFLSQSDLKSYEEIKDCLKDLNISISEDLNLVRGLDYYCHTVFEFKTNEIGSQDTLIGGGRYNGLIKTLGGKDIPGIGWAGGVERLMLLMTDVASTNEDIHLSIKDSACKRHALKIYDFLIKNNLSLYWNYKYNLKKSLSLASEKKVKYIIIVGEEEKTNDNYIIKNLYNGEQKIVKLSNILDHIK